ncbi:unnamed protein product [Mytilus edulis]|uniref:Uncharacterized protein n=1 Tax=Mytilus edulis TaxID=6550 RepID=A0A8S3QC26_MYTED|nr:unnamed protein product [Mytilus edulis]
MANYKRQEPIFTKSYKIRTSFTPNLNRNPINSVRPSVDYSDVDFDSIDVHLQKKDEEDTVKPINDAKRRTVFDRLGPMPTKTLNQQKLPSQEKKTESRKRKNTSRPHSTESKNRKTIRISNIKKHGESNNEYRHNAHDHNDISIDTQLIGRTRTPEKSRSPKNRSRKSHFSPRRQERSYSSKDKTEYARNAKRKHEKADSRHDTTGNGIYFYNSKSLA